MSTEEIVVPSVFAVCVAAVLCVFLFAVSGCDQNATRIAGEKFTMCVQGGGDWIPTTGKDGACIVKALR